MANFNNKNGHWITTKQGKHIFIAEDDVDKQEREIAERRHQTQVATADHNYANAISTPTLATNFKDYSKIGTRTQAVQQFEQDTGVKVTFDPEDDNICTKTNLYMVLNTVAEMKQKYPQQLRFLKSVGSFNDPGSIFGVAMAQANMNNVYINAPVFSKHQPQLQKMYAQSVSGSNNYHPKGTTAKDILTHELGHIMFFEHIGRMNRRLTKHDLSDMLEVTMWSSGKGKASGTTSKYIENEINQALTKALGSTPQHGVLGYANPKFKHPTAISGYAATSHHELMAEAVADYVANGDKASPLSQELVKILHM
jgi:hypothetical protein